VFCGNGASEVVVVAEVVVEVVELFSSELDSVVSEAVVVVTSSETYTVESSRSFWPLYKNDTLCSPVSVLDAHLKPRTPDS
jgi:hypothetical protein